MAPKYMLRGECELNFRREEDPQKGTTGARLTPWPVRFNDLNTGPNSQFAFGFMNSLLVIDCPEPQSAPAFSNIEAILAAEDDEIYDIVWTYSEGRSPLVLFAGKVGTINVVDLSRLSSVTLPNPGRSGHDYPRSRLPRPLRNLGTRTLWGHGQSVRCLARLPQCDWHVASASDDLAVRIWDIRQETCLCLLFNHELPVHGMFFNPADPRTLFTCGADLAVRIYDLNGNGNADSNSLEPTDALEMASGRSRKTPNRGSVSKNVSSREYSGARQVFWTRSVHSSIITQVHVDNGGMIVSKSNVGDIFAWLPRGTVTSDALDASDEDPDCGAPVIPVARLRTGSRGPRRIALNDKELLVATTKGIEVYDWERVVEESVADGTRSKKVPKMDLLAPEEDVVTVALSGEGRDAELIAVTRNGKLIRFSRYSTSGRRRPASKTGRSAVHVETPPMDGDHAIVPEKVMGIVDVGSESDSTSTNTPQMNGAVSGVDPPGQLPGIESFPSHEAQGIHTNGRSSEQEFVDVPPSPAIDGVDSKQRVVGDCEPNGIKWSRSLMGQTSGGMLYSESAISVSKASKIANGRVNGSATTATHGSNTPPCSP